MPFNQASNSKQQSPCEIAGALEAACQGFCAFEPAFHFHFDNSRFAAVFELGPLMQGTKYTAPQMNSSAQKCECNTVMFRYMINLHTHSEQALIVELCSLYMACTACQNATTQSWTSWSQFCTEVHAAQYPESIPLNTAVQNWAFLDYTVRARHQRCYAKSLYLTFLFRLEMSLILQPRSPPAINQRDLYRSLRLFRCPTVQRARALQVRQARVLWAPRAQVL